MATTYKLVMNFKNAGGKTISYSYPYCKQEFTAAQVKLVMQQ